MASVTVTISGVPKDLASAGVTRDTPREVARNIDNLIWQAIQGAMNNANPSICAVTSANDAAWAYGTLTISGGSGAVGGTIAGTAKTVTWGTSDTASAAALAAAINADTTINQLVHATSAAGVVTITANVMGVQGNQFTLVASGTGVTAGHLASGKFTGGAGSDTWCAMTSYNF